MIGDLSKSCKYLMENTRYSLNNYLATYGVLLESPVSNSTSFWTVYSFDRSVQTCFSTGGSGDPIPGGNGVRPAIEVAKSNISY